MALKITIDNEYEMQNIFSKWDRDYYSLDGYKAILDYFEETDCGCDSELDVIGICCDFTEYEEDCMIAEQYDTFLEWADGMDYTTDWYDENGFDEDDALSDADESRMLEELGAEYWDDYKTDALNSIEDSHTIIKLDNGNYLMIG